VGEIKMNQEIIILLLAINMLLILTDIIKIQKAIKILQNNENLMAEAINKLYKEKEK
jgi:hypothetical protein